MMSAFDCYKEYVALKNHFTKPGYDYFKYNGKMKLNYASFEKRNDKLFFQKLAKHEDPQGLIVSNLLRDKKLWIRDLAYSEVSEKTFQEWQRRKQSLTYTFKQELEQLLPNFDANFKVSGNHPHLMKLYFSKKVSIETMVILVDLVKCSKHWYDQLQYDPVADEVLNTIVKYRPFLDYDREKVKNIVVEKFSETG